MSQESTPGANTSSSGTGEPEEELYEVEQIVGWKVDEEDFYLNVRWVGYGPDDDTWELETSVTKYANEVVEDYYNKMSGSERQEIIDKLKALVVVNEKIIEEKKKKKKEEEEEASASSSTSTSPPEKKKKKLE